MIACGPQTSVELSCQPCPSSISMAAGVVTAAELALSSGVLECRPCRAFGFGFRAAKDSKDCCGRCEAGVSSRAGARGAGESVSAKSEDGQRDRTWRHCSSTPTSGRTECLGAGAGRWLGGCASWRPCPRARARAPTCHTRVGKPRAGERGVPRGPNVGAPTLSSRSEAACCACGSTWSGLLRRRTTEARK